MQIFSRERLLSQVQVQRAISEALEPRRMLSVVAFAPQESFALGGKVSIAVTGDFNGDGKPDILTISGNTYQLNVLINNGDGTFQSPHTVGTLAAPGSFGELTVGDLNGDGKTDIVAITYNGQTSSVAVFLGNGDGTFAAPRTAPISSNGLVLSNIGVADVNGDGKPDLVFVQSPSDPSTQLDLMELINEGNGNFAAPIIAATFAVSKSNTSGQLAVGDLNGDGKPDVVFADNNDDAVRVFLGQANGTFEVGASFSPGNHGYGGVRLVDLNGDGRKDLILITPNNAVDVLLGNGDGTFAPGHTFTAGGIPLYGLEVADFNGDGKKDIVVPDLGDGAIAVLQGNGDGTFAPPVQFATGPKPIAIAVADFNGDGKVDLVVTNASFSGSASVSVLLNKTGEAGAGGQIIPPLVSDAPLVSLLPQGLGAAPGATPLQVTLADVNGDGKPDLVEANYYQKLNGQYDLVHIVVAPGNGDGTFGTPKVVATLTNQNFGEAQALHSVDTLIVKDVTGDGVPDIITQAYTYGKAGIAVLAGNGDGTFKSAVFSQTVAGFMRAIAVADVNGDGKPDVVEQSRYYNQSTMKATFALDVLLGNGNGTFAAPASIAQKGVRATALTLTDVNGDGKPDIVSANGYFGTVSVLLNNGNGTFEAAATYAALHGDNALAVGDLNADGKPDIVTADFEEGEVSVLLNTGNGTFASQQTYAVGGLPTSVAIGDVTDDGVPDIIVSNGADKTVSILDGLGGGAFAAQRTLDVGLDPSGVLVSDLNGDGKPDLTVWNAYGVALSGAGSTLPGSVSVFLNDVPVFQLMGSTLNVTGTTGNDSIAASVSGSNLNVSVGATQKSFALGSVTQLVFSGGLGNDTLNVKAGVSPAMLLGGAGADSLRAHNAEPDTLVGGAGPDTLKANTGNDLLNGGRGADVLLAISGNDTLHGGRGRDSLVGGSGSTFLAGGAGSDTVVGSMLGMEDVGMDTLVGGAGSDSLRGDGGDVIQSDPTDTVG